MEKPLSSDTYLNKICFKINLHRGKLCVKAIFDKYMYCNKKTLFLI